MSEVDKQQPPTYRPITVAIPDSVPAGESFLCTVTVEAAVAQGNGPEPVTIDCVVNGQIDNTPVSGLPRNEHVSEGDDFVTFSIQTNNRTDSVFVRIRATNDGASVDSGEMEIYG